MPPLALIGYGEAGSTFARAAGWGDRVSAWDIDPLRRSAMARGGVTCASDAGEALAQCEIALCLVTADAALRAARDYAGHLPKSAMWCDMNSVAPHTKASAAEAIHAAGGRYVDVAVMAPVEREMAVPLLVSGPDASHAVEALQSLGFASVRAVGERIGQASAIKMSRSIMVKGIEALTDEMMAAATAAGVADEVLASLDASEKAVGWKERAAYNRERMATHGIRRAEEMEQVVETLRALGVEPLMSEATAKRQRGAAGRKEQAA